MKREDWRKAFGATPDDFELRLRTTLDELEDNNMKTRYKMTTGILIAALIALMIAGAAMAAGELGIFKVFESAATIVPLDGADELVMTNVGSASNNYAQITVEEAVYDGQGAIVELKLTPVDPDNNALLAEGFEDLPEDVYKIEETRVPVSKDDDVSQLADDEVVEIDGALYYADAWERRVVGRKDGKPIVLCDVEARVVNVDDAQAKAWGVETDNFLFSWQGEAQPDGSVLLWGEGFAQRPMGDTLDLELTLRTRVGDGEPESVTLPVTLVKGGDERRVELIPESEDAIERVKITSAYVTYTPIRAYLSIDYDYLNVDGEDMGVTIRLYDVDGNEIVTGSGYGEWPGATTEGWSSYHDTTELQSTETLPDEIVVEAKVIGEDRSLGKVTCKVAK